MIPTKGQGQNTSAFPNGGGRLWPAPRANQHPKHFCHFSTPFVDELKTAKNRAGCLFKGLLTPK